MMQSSEQDGVKENDPSEVQLGLVYDRVRLAYARLRARATGGWVFADGAVEVWACPFLDLFNGLMSPAWPEVSVEAFWRKAVRLYKRTGQDMYVSLGPSTRPSSLASLVERDGFRLVSRMPYMHLDLADLKPFAAIDGLRIERIEDFSFFEKHEHPWLGPVNTPYRALKLQFLRRYGEGPAPRLWQFVALSHRKLVGAATVFACGNEIAIFDVVVKQQVRRKGIGTRLVVEACRIARDKGIRFAGLGASGKGIGLYRKIGFREAGVYADYHLPEEAVATLGY